MDGKAALHEELRKEWRSMKRSRIGQVAAAKELEAVGKGAGGLEEQEARTGGGGKRVQYEREANCENSRSRAEGKKGKKEYATGGGRTGGEGKRIL